jgi:hypothetical protein
MTPGVKVALIICGTLIALALICCGGLIVIGAVAPGPTPLTPPPYPTASYRR